MLWVREYWMGQCHVLTVSRRPVPYAPALGSAHRCHRIGLAPATGTGLTLPHLAGTGLRPVTSAPGLGPLLPHLHRD